MSRAVAFLVRNWPLKLGAIGLATVLYAGLVVSQNAQTWSGQVPIQPLGQPSGAFLLDNPGSVTFIRLYAPPDVASQLSSQDFSATIDLSGIKASADAAPTTVPVQLTALDDRIQILDFRPREVPVRLDPIVSKDVPVTVDHGTIPAGLELGDQVVTPATVTVRGGSTLVDQVTHAVASVIVDPNGINVDTDVDINPEDDRGDAIEPVNVTPDHVHVHIDVTPAASSRSVPVTPVLNGTPPAGYQVASVQVVPAVVTVTGDPAVLATLTAIPTVPIDVSRATGQVSTSVAFAPPDGVTVVGATQAQVTVSIAPQRGSQTFTVGVTLVGAHPDRSYQLASSSVLITLGGNLPTLAGIDGTTLRATLDVTNLGPGTQDVTVVFVLPAGTTLVSIAPTSVAVTVSVIPSPSPT
ncbi:MAG TPA: CdaR family protein [Candidatus Baltobacteraceae bacterium]|nr:CdaR family protein [Candidatus Baltobacteraceae bacterium]